ncbi:MAG: phosphate ABC transporter ATP-binding protein [Chloroflexota bacterium]|nr:phosphate ABC transporter ATP-binding protein [Chloroflexota bacterium]
MKNLIFQLRDVGKDYDGLPVLQVGELDVVEGEVLAVVGPSGAGKSTLLRMLNFLETPSRGCIHFRGSDYGPNRKAPIQVRRSITTVFQDSILLRRSVKANVCYGLRLRGNRNGTQMVDAALTQVGLADYQTRSAKTLSGGEAQRVALARAMVLQPQVMLLDEPTANLDPHNVGLIENIVKDINRESGTTIVLVTHNVFQAKRLAHRVVFMLNGNIVEINETKRFFETPDDPRTAAFIKGEMVF